MTRDVYTIYPQLIDPGFVRGYDFEACHTKLNPTEAFSEFDVAVALLATLGNLSATASLLGRSRRSVEGFIARHEFLPLLLSDLEAAFLDEIEQSYKSLAISGDGPAARFFLSTLGKDRGYVPRHEQTGKDGEPLTHQILVAANEAKHKLAAILDSGIPRAVEAESDARAVGGTSV